MGLLNVDVRSLCLGAGASIRPLPGCAGTVTTAECRKKNNTEAKTFCK